MGGHHPTNRPGQHLEAAFEGGQVAKVLEEVFFQQSGVTTASDMTEIGRHLNVEKLFFLGIHRLYPNYKISVKSPTLKLAQRLIQSTLPDDERKE